MAYAKNYPVLQNDEHVHIGGGYLRIGAPDETYDQTAMENAGCIDGNAEFTPEIEMAELMAGSPGVLIKSEPKTIGATLKVTFLELNALRIQKAMGLGEVISHAKADVVITDEEVTLNGINFLHLIGTNVKYSPAVSVAPSTSTAADYTENTDYVIDYDNGLIRRVPTGSIADGETVLVSYTYTRQAYSKFKQGVSPHSYVYPIEYVVPTTSGNGRRMKIIIPKAVPTNFSSLAFGNDDFMKLEVTYKAVFDRTQTPDSGLYSIEWEDQPYVA